jgi:hypothetical protein
LSLKDQPNSLQLTLQGYETKKYLTNRQQKILNLTCNHPVLEVLTCETSLAPWLLPITWDRINYKTKKLISVSLKVLNA